VLKVARPTAEECEWLLKTDAMGLLHLAAARRCAGSLLDKGTAIGMR
jgi:hypothetical protein